jgi:hypothetical protein
MIKAIKAIYFGILDLFLETPFLARKVIESIMKPFEMPDDMPDDNEVRDLDRESSLEDDHYTVSDLTLKASSLDGIVALTVGPTTAFITTGMAEDFCKEFDGAIKESRLPGFPRDKETARLYLHYNLLKSEEK